jgi:hypothetical protein
MKQHLLSFLKFKQHDINYYQNFNFKINLKNYNIDNIKTKKYINFELEKIKRHELSKNTNYVFSLLNDNNEPEHYKVKDYLINDNLVVNKKRKFTEDSESKSVKKKKDDHINFDKMISASSITNYFLNDPVIDFLKYYKIDNSLVYDKNKKSSNIYSNFSKNNFEDVLIKKGNEFEAFILEQLKNKYEYIQIGESYQAKSIPLFQKTIKAINDKIPIIIQGVLHFYEKNIYGCPDLMVRGDILNKMYPDTLADDELDCYYIVDIKWSCLKMSCKGDYILNSGLQSYYKGQVLIYTMALSNILGKNITKGFILAKKYQWKTVDYWQDKIGIIDYSSKDYIYYNKVDKAIEWNLKVREEGDQWTLLPPCIPELYPNMKNNKDGKYRKIKNIHANKINEMTLIWNVQVNHRNNALQKGICSTNDPNCNSKALGINGANAFKIDAILEINKSICKKVILPNKIKNNYLSWRSIDNKYLEIYLDYETINDLEGNNFIFMIGIGYIQNSKWNYKCFVLENKKKQIDLYTSFWSYINILLDKFDKEDVLFIHWYNAEPIMYNKAAKQFDLKEKTFLDLYKIFIEEPIVVKGSKSFKLKDIAKAMYNNKLIKTTWEENNKCDNGLNAMILANDIYEQSDNVKLTDMLDIVNYNEIDCKVLYEIITYLREKH